MSAAPDSNISPNGQASEALFRSMIANAPIATCLFTGVEMRVDVANDLMLSYWGKDGSILGLPFCKAVPELIGQPFPDILDQVYRSGEILHSEASAANLSIGGKSGTYYFTFTCKPLFDNNGKVYAIMGMGVDVTEEVKARALLNEANQRKIEELQLTNRNLEEFAYAASHDLKEPIRKLLFFADLLHRSLHTRLTEREEHYFTRLEAAGKRMFSVVEDLLSYSQVNQQFTLAPVDLNEIVALVLGDLELQIAQKRANIQVKTLFTLRGHARSLQQVFQNLISNALKYAAPDRPPVVTIVSSVMAGKDIPLALPLREQQLSYYVVAVSDNGVGFEQADATRIFDVFTRLHGSDMVKGTGVGLAIVRKVMENHHGFVRAESELGKGSCFYLYFPRTN